MHQYSFLAEVHPVVANAWKNHAIKSALIGAGVGGTVNKLRGDSFTKGALVGGGIGLGANAAIQTGRAMSAVKSTKGVQQKATDQLEKLAKKRRRLRNPESIAKLDAKVAKQKERVNRTIITQINRNKKAKALRDARRSGDTEAINKITGNVQRAMNRKPRVSPLEAKRAHDSGYVASLRKNRRV